MDELIFYLMKSTMLFGVFVFIFGVGLFWFMPVHGALLCGAGVSFTYGAAEHIKRIRKDK